MAYCTTAQVKTYAGISSADDDTLIGDLITRAQAAIDAYTQRTFEASTNTTRNYTVGEDTEGPTLYLDADLASINSVTNKADATTTETITSTEYVTIPRDDTPYHAIKLLSSSDKVWDFDDDPENGIQISGKWAYSEAAPDDIVHACIRLATWLYRQKDTNLDGDRPLLTGDGITIMPSRIPADIRSLLDIYRKIII